MDSHGMVDGWPGEYWLAMIQDSEKLVGPIQRVSEELLRRSESHTKRLATLKKEWKECALSQDQDKKSRMALLQSEIANLEQLIYRHFHRPVALNRAELYRERAGVTQ